MRQETNLKGQNLYLAGRAKMAMTMSMAGVASATVDLDPRDVILNGNSITMNKIPINDIKMEMKFKSRHSSFLLK